MVVAQVVDRMEVLHAVLAARPNAYQDSESLLHLAHLLGVSQRSQEVHRPPN